MIIILQRPGTSGRFFFRNILAVITRLAVHPGQDKLFIVGFLCAGPKLPEFIGIDRIPEILQQARLDIVRTGICCIDQSRIIFIIRPLAESIIADHHQANCDGKDVPDHQCI